MIPHDREVAAIADQVRTLVEEAYRRGFADGGTAMRDNILKAAGAPAPTPSTTTVPPAKTIDARDRAPRGTVGILVQRVLREAPGLGAVEIGKQIAELDSRVSPTSANNELSRYEEKRYRKVDGCWFLIGDAEKETAEEPSEAASAEVFSFERR